MTFVQNDLVRQGRGKPRAAKPRRHRPHQRSARRSEARDRVVAQYRTLIESIGYRCELNRERFPVSAKGQSRSYCPTLVIWSGRKRVLVEVISSGGDSHRVRGLNRLRDQGERTMLVRVSDVSRFQQRPGELKRLLHEHAFRK